MLAIRRIFSNALHWSIFILFVILPSVNTNSLMNGTQSGKTFFFIWGVAIITSLSIVRSCFGVRFAKLNLTIIDLLLLTFMCHVLLRNSWTNLENSLLFFELLGVAILYVILSRLPINVLFYSLISIVISGTFQSVYGILQLLRFYPSHHEQFFITGSFFNPGPYAGYLSAVFPISLGICLFNIRSNSNPLKTSIKNYFFNTQLFDNNNFEKKLQRWKKLTDYFSVKLLSVISLICLFVAILASYSRAAWLAVIVSSLYLVSVKYHSYQYIKTRFNTVTNRLFLPLLIVSLLTVGGVGLYQLKKGSADGRLLIWKVSTEMIKERPFLGYGYDGFKRHYMNHQAEYFKDNTNNEQTLIAGDSNYAFNELIQLTIENGIIGIIPIFAIIIILFVKILTVRPYQRFDKNNIAVHYKSSFGTDQTSIHKTVSQKFLLHISYAMILSIFIFSLFSYSLQILPIKVCLTVALSIAAGNMINKFNLRFSIGPNSKTLNYTLKSIILIGFFFVLRIAIINVHLVKMSYVNWEKASVRYNYGIYNECLIEYKKAYPVLKNDGEFLTQYGKALSMAQQYTEAVPMLRRATKYYPNTLAYTALGENYAKLGQIKSAEEAYLLSWYMIPGRIYPRYLLAKLYQQNGEKERAIDIAKELLCQKVKFESKTNQEIRSEMQKLITDYSN